MNSKEPAKAIEAAPAAELIVALQISRAFDHPVKYIKLIETHISWVLLTGDYAYKIKKPVNFGFLDFSTLEKRQFYCAEELRLNRRFSPDIYLQVVSIRGTSSEPRISDNGPVIEYAVKMREFSQQDLLSNYATSGKLTAAHIDAIADAIAGIHDSATRATAESEFGTAEQVSIWSRENLIHISDTMPADALPRYFDALKNWCLQMDHDYSPVIDARKQNGFVRECHGDLHLRNMALIDGRVTLFDCIEFNPALRWIDTISEVAFIAMDLQARGYPGYCWRFINRYLESSGDYEGSSMLRYYFVYRALVRGKVEALRIEQEYRDSKNISRHFQPAIEFLSLANQWASNRRPGMIVMHGLSGSGKSTIAGQLLETIGAIRIRSDVERKRLFDIRPLQQTGSSPGQGIYSADATEATYRQLRRLAATIIDAGFSVIVDATFLLKAQRDQFIHLADEHSLTAIVIDCEAPENILRERIIKRSKGSDDASEADLEVLDRQLQTQQPLSAEEYDATRVINCTPEGISPAQIDKIRQCLVRNAG